MLDGPRLHGDDHAENVLLLSDDRFGVIDGVGITRDSPQVISDPPSAPTLPHGCEETVKARPDAPTLHKHAAATLAL
jgi:hypothetical protein